MNIKKYKISFDYTGLNAIDFTYFKVGKYMILYLEYKIKYNNKDFIAKIFDILNNKIKQAATFELNDKDYFANFYMNNNCAFIGMNSQIFNL